MGPRKRARRNPAEGSSASTSTSTTAMPSQPSSASSSSTPASQSQPPEHPRAATGATDPAVPSAGQEIQHESQQQHGNENGTPIPSPGKAPKQVHKTSSWYGSWPRPPKSSASTQVARETILGGTLQPKSTADFSRFDTKKSADSMSIDGVAPLTSSLPKIHEDEAATNEQVPNPAPEVDENATAKPGDAQIKRVDDETIPDAAPSAKPQDTGLQATDEPVPKPPTTSSWRGWFGNKTVTQEPSISEPAPPSPPDQEAAPGQEVCAPRPVASEPVEPVASETKPTDPVQDAQSEQQVSETHGALNQTRPSSWFGFWATGVANPAPLANAPGPASDAVETSEPPKEPEDVVMEDAPPIVADAMPTPPPKAGSTWAFWSRDTSSKSGKMPAVREEPGQLAVIGDSSESHPKRTNSIEVKDTQTKDTPVKEAPLKSTVRDDQTKVVASPAKEASSKKSKRVRPQSMDIDDLPPIRPSTPKSDPAAKAGPSKTPTPAKALPPNLVLPSFNNTYRLKENPSIVQQIAQLLLRTQQPPANHVFLARERPKIKNAIAIGVHGLFPATYLRPMIGQPTGTSIKFANHCAESIRRWADANGCGDCEIEKVALEGEGKISDRVENLWRLLLNWIDHIRNADLIIVGCHSQGVPVGIMLLAKLIELGIITTAKIGICAMAGVSLGPFPDYRSSMGILMGTAAELWEFADPESEVSKRLEYSVKAVLRYGTRITYVGSIDDQLVPLESAIYAPAHHPYIYRAVFIDGRIHTPDFIAHLVGFALKLRNLGVTDHGLVRELSQPLAGSLYSGEGHSRLYDDEQVYDLAVTHALETTDVGDVPCEVIKHHGPSTPNPYHLPWIMRGLLEEDFVKTELSSETAELLCQFDDWKPTTKALKDVKYRLEAVRSKL
ncbi:hypothetical protein B0T24DRAFT_172238 [Lasiosphaeria ovina]|uniref:YMC020W-like alpha/beta hydrolase domain-containing protein n=1 Tax=Lasiosphaeria ovina TaxID=92902 RepID=A0AAE0NEA2_9PEZI|nr:hypothetical protein B0T24DRAFT_172238 [Lasiosphaeria ovina]